MKKIIPLYKPDRLCRRATRFASLSPICLLDINFFTAIVLIQGYTLHSLEYSNAQTIKKLRFSLPYLFSLIVINNAVSRLLKNLSNTKYSD